MGNNPKKTVCYEIWDDHPMAVAYQKTVIGLPCGIHRTNRVIGYR